MAEIRFLRSWTDEELERRMEEISRLPLNFSTPEEEMTLENGWNHYYSDSAIAHEAPGPPEREGPFERVRVAVENYQHSDPRIVVGHFDPDDPLLGRPMLLECKILGLHYLVGVVVGAVRSEAEGDRTVWGFRYDTLQGHFEVGSEWFLVTKHHDSGEIRFRVDAHWRPGEFPNWWSRVGFSIFGPRYQERWHRRTHQRLSLLATYTSSERPRPGRGRLVHQGPDVEFRSFQAKRRPDVEHDETRFR